jgi:hypothetical protein
MAYCTSKMNKNEKGIEKFSLLAIWPEGTQKKFH